MIDDKETIEETVIKGGYCIGCGICALHADSPYEIVRTKYLQYQAQRKSSNSFVDKNIENSLKEVCPFSGESLSEDELGKDIFGLPVEKYNDKLGYFLNTYVGSCSTESYRDKGSSGGLVSWILSELLNKKMIDGVIHVKDSTEKGTLFEYFVSNNIEDLAKGAKSKYYPIELSNVLDKIKDMDGRYAIVGVPCFIKAVRLLMKKEFIFRERIRYCIGLVCGHLKSGHYANMLAWQVGIHPSKLEWIDFRTKMPNQSADNYAVSASDKKNPGIEDIRMASMRFLYGGNWGYGFFKYKACDFCDDVLAETADITFGDAWLPEFISDDRGTNIIIVRNTELDDVLKDAVSASKIELKDLSIEDVIKSQDAGIRHRREGLAYRLKQEIDKGNWVPVKRVKPEILIEKRTQDIQNIRSRLRELSYSSFVDAIKENDFNVFVTSMAPLLKEYNKYYSYSLLSRIKRKIRQLTKME